LPAGQGDLAADGVGEQRRGAGIGRVDADGECATGHGDGTGFAAIAVVRAGGGGGLVTERVERFTEAAVLDGSDGDDAATRVKQGGVVHRDIPAAGILRAARRDGGAAGGEVDD